MNRFLLTTAAAFGLTASAAFAGDVLALPQATAADGWSGAYAGLHYAEGDAEFEAAGAAVDTGGTGLGAHLGYLSNRGAFVTGGELAITSAGTNGTDDTVNFIEGKLMAGYNAGRVLPYATLGVSRASILEGAETGTLYGVGAKMKATDNLILGLEWSRATFKDVGEVDGLDAEKDSVGASVSFRF